ncbi:MAG: hypothetical protein ABFS46_01130, partial [Myxococcota bacterium]
MDPIRSRIPIARQRTREIPAGLLTGMLFALVSAASVAADTPVLRMLHVVETSEELDARDD